jgi:hypothetical protein
MQYISILKEGAAVAGKNWQLIFVQFLFMVLSFLSLLVIVGIPLAVSFVIFGLDLTEILRQRNLIGVFQIAAAMLRKSLPIVIFVILGFVLYVASIIAMWIFAFAGTIGSVARTILNGQKFSARFFWAEAKRLFFPVFIFTNVAGFGFAILALIMGLLSESSRKIISIAETQEATLAVFLSIFFFLVLLSVGLFLFFVTLEVAFYGCGYLVFNRPRPFKAFRQIADYLYRHPSAHLLMGILVIGYLAAGSIVVTITSLLALIPTVGPALAMPFQFLSQAAHGYVSLIILASIFLFYYRTGYLPSLPAPRDVTEDTYQTPADEPLQAPVEKAENRAE